jgi:hypothetical protein
MIYYFGATECFDFLILNYTSSNCLSSSEINALLSNSLNKYHPLLLYWSSFLCFVTTFALVMTYLPLVKFERNLNIWSYQILMFRVLTLNFIALALGSWWALQEGTWGGWWNWDASEVLGLLILLVVLWSIHTRQTINNVAKVVELALISLLFVVLSYYTLQLNFELTSHSFGSRFTYFFNNNLFLLEVAALVVLALVAQLSHKFRLRTTFLVGIFGKAPANVQGVNFRTYLFWLFLVTFVLILVTSFLPLLNYFVWRYLKVNSFNTYILLEFWVYTLTLGLLLTTAVNTPVITIVFALLFVLNLDFILLFLLWGPLLLRRVTSLHMLIYTFLILNLWSYQFQVTFWCDTSPLSYLVGGQTNLCINAVNYSCSNYMVDRGVYSFNTVYNIVSYLNFYYKSNANQLNNFWLYLDNLTTGSLFYNNLAWHSSASYIELLILNNLSEVLLVFIVSLIYLQLTPLLRFVKRF